MRIRKSDYDAFVEEAVTPLLDDETIAAMGGDKDAAALSIACALGLSDGTVESVDGVDVVLETPHDEVMRRLSIVTLRKAAGESFVSMMRSRAFEKHERFAA